MKRNMTLLIPVALWVVATGGALTLACTTGGGDPDAGVDGGGPVDAGPYGNAEAAAIAAVATFDTEGFTRISAEPFTTQHAASPLAHTWINDAAVADYQGIDPSDATDTAGPFPEGTVVVKEQILADGGPAGRLLVMAKFPEGYNPDANDWWWALFTNQNEISDDKGVVGYCINCHTGNGFVDTDYLGGVATDNQQ